MIFGVFFDCTFIDKSIIISNINSEDKDEANFFVSAINTIINVGRKYKIHLIIATHNATIRRVKIDTGSITSRIAFKLANSNNSMTVLGETGAEHLHGKCNILLKSDTDFIRLQVGNVTKDEIKKVLSRKPDGYDNDNKIKITKKEPEPQPFTDNEPSKSARKAKKDNELLACIAMLALRQDIFSSNFIQKTHHMGKKSDKIMDKLTQMGIISEKDEERLTQPRSVLPKTIDDLSSETLNFLKHYGHSAKDVTDAISARYNYGVDYDPNIE